MVKCPHCNAEGGFQAKKGWKYGRYDVKEYVCNKCNGKFNYYVGINSKGNKIEFVIRIGGKKPR